ncbi:nucleoside hydrolase [Streptomyces graminifolii]|uniref:nucleoside hydrolase n=1 Tax=Streptomyces graminifolii TaxID=1266771 RepID=UPI004059E53C
MARNIIIDCDPGHDDAVALLLALGNPEVELIGVTTVAGNNSLEKITRNARSVLELAGARHVPVHAGADRPLLRHVIDAADVHGASGIDGAELPEPLAPLGDKHAVRFLVDQIMEAEPGSITLVPTAPLTNIALAARLEPRIVDRVAEVVLMGGSGAVGGNKTSAAEFNILVDPEAARIVFTAGWKVTMVGLDVTQQALATSAVIQRIRQVGGACAHVVADLLTENNRLHRRAQTIGAAPIHDPVAVARVIAPDLVQVQSAPIHIELDGAHTAGATVVDRRASVTLDGVRTCWATELDVERFWDLVVEALAALHAEAEARS